ncbi:unnamed protein product [Eruca vesicaria subsp. sativa]|uniref:Uncharacterized protein n=1 Tax=Eruca vesicaria subsp. sativa TaxID=29727 RepID=A0ABC8KB65_ERUVS|nr:unnamed protein product [Eruca vesicaria subsp. sativa]
MTKWSIEAIRAEMGERDDKILHEREIPMKRRKALRNFSLAELALRRLEVKRILALYAIQAAERKSAQEIESKMRCMNILMDPPVTGAGQSSGESERSSTTTEETHGNHTWSK